MKISNRMRLVLAGAIGLSFVAGAQAADVNGTWATDPSACSRALVKSDKGVTIYEKGTFIIGDKEIKGRSATCQIKARKDDGNFVHLLVECPTDIVENQLTLRIDGENKMTRIFPGMPKMNTTYFRCRQ